MAESDAAKRLRASSFADLPPRSIPISTLSNPSAAGYVSMSAGNFAVTMLGAAVIETSVQVPSGFDSCVVYLTGRVYARNTTAGVDYLYARTVTNGVTSTALPIPVAAVDTFGDVAANTAHSATVLSGLGSSFTLQVWAASATADWTADPGNTADLSGVLLWF